MSGYTAMAIAIGGAVMGAVGSAQQQQIANQNAHARNVAARNNAIAAQQAASYKAQISYNNSVIAAQNAASIREAATEAAQRHSVRVRNTVGALHAGMAANGFLVDDTDDSTGTDLEAGLRAAGTHDIRTIYHNAELEARRALIEKEQFIREGELNVWKASLGDTGVGYTIGGESSALTGAASFMSSAAKAASLMP